MDSQLEMQVQLLVAWIEDAHFMGNIIELFEVYCNCNIQNIRDSSAFNLVPIFAKFVNTFNLKLKVGRYAREKRNLIPFLSWMVGWFHERK